jgi:hypothetical protein
MRGHLQYHRMHKAVTFNTKLLFLDHLLYKTTIEQKVLVI